MSSRIRWPHSPRIVSLLSAVFLVNCIRVADLSHSALRYNEAVEEAQNRMLLLNVVRAKMFRPMYITDLTKLSGSIKLDINSGGIETDFGPYIKDLVKGKDALTSGKLTPSVDYVQNPTFDVNVLSNQEFMKGFTSPCTKDLLAYYWEQGWPPEFLLYLFVHDVDDVELVEGNKKKVHYENYPDPFDPDLRKLERFGTWVTKFVRSNPRFVRIDVKIGPCLDKDAVGDLGELVKATKEGLSVAKVDTMWQLKKQDQDLILMAGAKADGHESDEEKCESQKCEAPVDKDSGPTLHLRSPEGILFYLGELMRVEHNSKKFPAVCIGNHLWPLFVAFEKHEKPLCKAASVAVKYEGTEFIIPDRELKLDKEGKISDPAAPQDPICRGLDIRPDGNISSPDQAQAEPVQAQTKRVQPIKIIAEENLSCFGGMSMESFSLLTQLIALQKSAKDTPTTSLVRAIVQ